MIGVRERRTNVVDNKQEIRPISLKNLINLRKERNNRKTKTTNPTNELPIRYQKNQNPTRDNVMSFPK